MADVETTFGPGDRVDSDYGVGTVATWQAWRDAHPDARIEDNDPTYVPVQYDHEKVPLVTKAFAIALIRTFRPGDRVEFLPEIGYDYGPGTVVTEADFLEAWWPDTRVVGGLPVLFDKEPKPLTCDRSKLRLIPDGWNTFDE